MDPLYSQLFENSPFVYCFNNPIVFYDKDGNIGVFGAFAGAAWEIVGQVTANMVTGKPLNDIDWLDVGIAFAFGAVGIPPGATKLKKVYKMGVNALESGLQANLNYTEKNGFESTFGGGINGYDAFRDFAVSFGFSTAVGASKTYKRALDNFDVKINNQKTHTKSMQTKQASQEKSLSNTQSKKQNQPQQEKVIQKTANLNNTKQAVTQSKVAETVVTAEKEVVKRTNSGIGTAATNISAGNILNPTGYQGPEYFFQPEKMGNTGMYFLDKDKTTIYNPQNKMTYDFDGLKLSNPKQSHVNPTQKVLVKGSKWVLKKYLK